jgi:hypothetical protein
MATGCGVRYSSCPGKVVSIAKYEAGGVRILAKDIDDIEYSAMAPALIDAAFQLMGTAPGSPPQIVRNFLYLEKRPWIIL